MLFVARGAAAGAILKLGDILVVEPGNASVSVIDAATGAKTTISQGGLLYPQHRAVGVALTLDGDVLVVVRDRGVIRVNPGTGAQSVLSEGGLFRDPWAIAVDHVTGAIYIADSGYDNDRPTINQAGKIIKIDPVSGAQQLIASGSPCNVFPSNAPCQNTTSAGSYLAHPYGIAVDDTGVPGTLIVADMSSFNGKGAIFRLQPVPNGTQTLLWGPSSAIPPPQVSQQSPLGCPMGLTVAPNGNLLTTVFTFPVPPNPTFPPPSGTYYGCSPPGIYRIDLTNNTQTVVSANAPAWQPNHGYALGDVVFDGVSHVHKAIVAGVSGGSAPNWTTTPTGATFDGTITWENVGPGANWLIPFGLDIEPAPNPPGYNIVVGDEGHSTAFRLNAAGNSVQPIASNLAYVTSVHVISVTPQGGLQPPPVRSNGQPVGQLTSGTSQTVISLATDINATCRYSPTSNVPYGSMTSTFSTTGGTTHSSTITGLSNGSSYSFYVRCQAPAGNPNTDDYIITFGVGPSAPVTSSFLGTEQILSENGTWDSPGAWADLRKDNGAYAAGLNALARRVTPAMAADQYAEITYSQDPGSSSWVGVMTRVQGAGNGSGYLAIAYAGEVRLYRVDDTSSLNFNQLAAATADLNATPRRLRLESQGNNHRVYLNGVQLISHNASGTLYGTGQPGLAASVFGGPTVKILSFEGGMISGADTIPPVRTNGQPTGALAAGTTQTTLSLATDENATCRYATASGVAYGSMANTFTTTGGTAHSTAVTGLTNGGSYNFYVRCQDIVGNLNTNDFVITFSVALAGGSTVTSSFSGTENPLSESGAWDSPGSWVDLQKDNGAFTTGLNAGSRLATPAMVANQYAEITFSQDPGSSSWVGVTTRLQSAADGSGYLAIAYAGEVRLYRTDDSGSLNFTQLASATVDISVAPRRLRLESQGDNHRVYFNGVQVISHDATGTVYANGQPGIAASVFGGPQIKILSFEGGNLTGADTTPPVRSNGQPTGTLPAGTTQTTLSLTTNENATCRYATSSGVAYGSMANTFTTTGGTAHSTTVPGLTNGGAYNFYARCQDTASNANPNDFVITFSVAQPSDVTPPVRSNGQPTGTFAAGTTQTTLSLTTNENGTCRYATASGVSYGSMPNTFATTGGTAHSTTVPGLTNGGAYNFYVRCQDTASNANSDDFAITFSVALASGSTVTSSFTGTENPLSESGAWDSPGTWADLQKSNGAFAAGLNGGARLVTPAMAANQYGEITYSQDPGSSSWVGVTTRLQGAGNGSGYLAIAYAGEVRLYRTDDSGSLSFVQLATASTDISVAPRRLRLESQGDNHRVYFNGVQVISHDATGTVYANGQPGIAASVFGGPQVKILSFEGGNLTGADTTPPVRSNGQPTGTLAAGTTQTTLSLVTNENATCRYATSSGVAYGSMANTFTTTGATTHSSTVTGLTNGGSYNFYVRCQDTASNTNANDFTISFSVAQPADTTPPVRSNGQPTGTLPAGTTQTTLSLTTNENATCRYATSLGVAYGSMTSTFTTTGGTAHSTTVSGLTNGTSYNYYVRCRDTAANANPDDFPISFSQAQPGPVSGLVAAYGFNEGSGTNVADSSGNGLSGAISGASWITQGKFGKALSFDGNDWVTVAAAPPLNLTTGMTLEAWIYPTVTNGRRDILIKEGTGGGIYNLYARNLLGRPGVNVLVGGTNRVAERGSALAANVWAHVAGTYDGAVLRLYINGVQAASTNIAGTIATSTGALRIGRNSLLSGYFRGRIDEIRIYNRALTPTEIQADMNTPVP